jgi:hypothetical protein
MAGSSDIIWLGQISSDNRYIPDLSVTQPNLRRIGDEYRHNGINLSTGGYKFVNIPNGQYLFYDGDTKKTNILGDTGDGGRNYFDGTLNGSQITSGNINKDRLPNDIPQSKISGLSTDLSNLSSSITTGLSTKAGLSSNNNFNALNIFSGYRPRRDDGIATGDFGSYQDFVSLDDMTDAISAAMISITGYAESPNKVRVSGNVTDENHKLYNTIYKGVNSFTGPAPSAVNICAVSIEGMGRTSDRMEGPMGVFRDYVNLIALGRHIKIFFYEANVSKNVTVENATVILGGGTNTGGSTSARTFQNVSFKNCRIYHWRNLTVKGGECNGCEFISPNGVTLTFDKNTSNKFCDVINCVSRNEAVFNDSVNYSGAMDIRTVPSLTAISDPTDAAGGE